MTERGLEERPDALEGRIDSWIGPLPRVNRVVETSGRTEDGAARGTESYLPLWLRVWGALDVPMFNIKVVR